MPRQTLRDLVGHRRSRVANRRLGLLLAFVAGAINAGGFLAVQRYTSHMTGIVSGAADDLALGHGALALAGVLLVAVFITGAATSTVLINWARRRRMHSEFALCLLLEAALLLVFGMMGAYLAQHGALLVPAAVALLCFIMGLQNAMVTKISQAEVRTTHMTGVVTDLGIELGKLFYWNRTAGHPPEAMVRANRDRLRLHALLLASFAGGGLVGALAFKLMSYSATVPIAVLLAVLAAVPILDDLQAA